MSEQKKPVGAGVGVLIIKDNKFLLGKRNSDPVKADSALSGEGSWTMPGGKIDFGESPLEGAVRETEEELCIAVKDARKVAELWFQMSDYPSLRCHVFLASEFEGEPTETPEAVPLWAPLDDIPYERMWEDDRHWLPQVLTGQTLIGKFSFEGERMLTKDIELGSEFL